jgi:hypothetical protein
MDTYHAAYWSSDPFRLSSSEEEEEIPDSACLWCGVIFPRITNHFASKQSVQTKVNVKTYPLVCFMNHTIYHWLHPVLSEVIASTSTSSICSHQLCSTIIRSVFNWVVTWVFTWVFAWVFNPYPNSVDIKGFNIYWKRVHPYKSGLWVH